MSKNILNYQHSKILSFCFVCILMLLSGCTVKLISSYDETTDKTVTALQKKVESFLITLESIEGLPECEYKNHKKFYDEVKIEISAIVVRARAIPDNEITIEQVELLKDSLKNLESLHKISCLSKDQIEPLRIAFNSSFTAILKLEFAKKRGESQ
ncbi:MAG: hypothetical protein GTO24_02880 [candidate division Zixibacteria bacterium]|nr:hypothetical protein [candidate division Zixibacteria bacterium]